MLSREVYCLKLSENELLREAGKWVFCVIVNHTCSQTVSVAWADLKQQLHGDSMERSDVHRTGEGVNVQTLRATTLLAARDPETLAPVPMRLTWRAGDVIARKVVVPV